MRRKKDLIFRGSWKGFWVSCGGEHTQSAGVCGLALSPAVQEILVKKSLARSMAAGAYHNLIVKDCGAVLSWGCGVFSSTGKSNDGCIPALGLSSNNNNDINKNAEEVIVPHSYRIMYVPLQPLLEDIIVYYLKSPPDVY